jgi:EAL domain-containing protein (putative c-di-GMP-specific phosphodiesterase class I)
MPTYPSVNELTVRKPPASFRAGGDFSAPFDFTMAFQPIVDIETRSVFAYEALLRGREQQLAREILCRVNQKDMYAFDQSCQIKAIEMAVQLGIVRSGASVSINFMPGAVYHPENSIRTTLETAKRVGLPMQQIIFEVTEDERIVDRAHLKTLFCEYRRHGLRTAIDDFGAGYSGLTLLADFQPDVVKIDRALIDGIDLNKPARSIVGAMVDVCRSLGIVVVAEGIERSHEAMVLSDLGVRYMQGYLFARPAFEALVEPLYEAMSA